jgi:hypothetical protein
VSAPLPPGRGLAWIVEGLQLARRAGVAFGGACLWVGLCNSLPLVGVLAGLAMPVFYAGLVRVLATADAGQRPRAAQAFAGFVEPGAFARLVPVLVLHLAFVAGVLAVIVAAGGEELRAMATLAESGGKPTEAMAAAVAARIAPTLLALLPVALFVQWIEMLAVPRAMLDGVGGGVALRESAAAALRHLLALLVNAVGLVPVGVLIVALFIVPMGIIGALQAVAPAIALVVQVPVLAAMVGAFVGVYAPVMYRATREVFGDATTPPVPGAPTGQIEV